MGNAEDVKITWSDTKPEGMAEELHPSCSKCGRPAPYAVSVPEGEAVSEVRFACPFCGHMNLLPGSYEAVREGGSLRMAFRDMTLSELIALREKLRTLAESEATLDDAEEAVAPLSAGLATWLKSRENRDEVRATLTLLLTAVGIVIATMTYTRASSPPPAVVEKVVVQLESGQVTDRGLPRRAECWCGSGARYKNCHGRAGRDSSPAVGSP
jgi:hypothetical protein